MYSNEQDKHTYEKNGANRTVSRGRDTNSPLGKHIHRKKKDKHIFVSTKDILDQYQQGRVEGQKQETEENSINCSLGMPTHKNREYTCTKDVSKIYAKKADRDDAQQHV